jgi:hypothetical protein
MKTESKTPKGTARRNKRLVLGTGTMSLSAMPSRFVSIPFKPTWGQSGARFMARERHELQTV